MELAFGDNVQEAFERLSASANNAQEAGEWNELARRSGVKALHESRRFEEEEEPDQSLRARLISSIGLPQEYRAGEVIINEGDAPDNIKVMYVQGGEVSIMRGEREVVRVGEGEILGEMTMLLGDTPNVSAVAATDVPATRLPSGLARRLRNRRPRGAPRGCRRVVRRPHRGGGDLRPRQHVGRLEGEGFLVPFLRGSQLGIAGHQ